MSEELRIKELEIAKTELEGNVKDLIAKLKEEQKRTGIAEHVVAMVPMVAGGEHQLVILTSRGRFFERSLFSRNFRTGPNMPEKIYEWKEFNGPEL